MFINIVFWLGSDIGRRNFFFRDRFTSFHTHASLPAFFFCFYILFHTCCSHVRVFGKTLVHEFLISYGHTEWYLRFTRGENNSPCFGTKLCLSKSQASPIKVPSFAYQSLIKLNVISVLRALCQDRRNGLDLGVINRCHCCRYVFPPK